MSKYTHLRSFVDATGATFSIRGKQPRMVTVDDIVNEFGPTYEKRPMAVSQNASEGVATGHSLKVAPSAGQAQPTLIDINQDVDGSLTTLLDSAIIGLSIQVLVVSRANDLAKAKLAEMENAARGGEVVDFAASADATTNGEAK